MAELDPKQILMRNKALLGAYALAIVPIVLYVLLVTNGVQSDFEREAQKLTTKKRQADSLASRIKADSPDDPVFTSKHVEQFKERAKQVKAQERELAALLVKRDVPFEEWFPKFKNVKPGQQPDYNEYLTYWRANAIPDLIAEYRDLVTGEDDVPRVYDQDPDRKDMKRSQKRYWVQKAILEAVRKAAGSEARLLSAVQFTDGPAVTAKPAEGEAKPLFRKSDVRLEVALPFPKVTHLVRELLAREVVFEITGLEVAKHPFRYEKTDIGLLVDGTGRVFTEDYAMGQLAKFEDWTGKAEDYVPEPRVRVALDLKVYDFDVELPPAEEGEQGDESGESAEEGK